jgi:cobaltochelatase CobS
MTDLKEMKDKPLTHQCAFYLLSKKSYGFAINTTRILKALEIPETSRTQTLKVLHHLVSIGIVDKNGTGNIRWELASKYRTGDNLWDAIEAVLNANPMGPKTAPKKSEVGSVSDDEVQRLKKEIEDIKEAGRHSRRRIEALEASKTPTTITIKKYDKPEIELEATVPANFQAIIDLAACRRNILMVGPAGCGKTTIASMVSKALNLRFEALPGSGGTNESHLLGRSIPNMQTGESTYSISGFVRCYSEGGVFLLDEMDATDPNLLLCLNSALANGYCSIPNKNGGEVVHQHPDFVMIATANTFGRGATRVYAGRNNLDDATLDRFRVGTVDCDYDEKVEAAVCPDFSIRSYFQGVRKRIEIAGLRRVMSTRFLKDAYIMHQHGWNLTQLTDTYFNGWSADEKAKVR